MLLLGGEPGIGKSTLLIQACAALACKDRRVVYISGEEAVDQVRLRALRLALARAPSNSPPNQCRRYRRDARRGRAPRASSSSIRSRPCGRSLVESAPGTVSQVRGSAQALIRFAKATGAAVILVGHVTKDGQIAGPRVVEHMVDAVISFEGEGGRDLRLLRAVKNRFGPTDEIGVFEMTGRGLAEVANPSALFLSARDSQRRARLCSPVWRAPARFSSSFRRWSRRVRLACRAAAAKTEIGRGHVLLTMSIPTPVFGTAPG